MWWRRVFVVVLVFLLVKEVTAWRAHHFIMECLSPEQVDLVVTKRIYDESVDRQGKFVNGAIGCVAERQTYLEIIVSRVLGSFLFYRP